MTGSPGLAPWLLHKRPLKSGLYKVSDPTNEVRGFSPKREQRFPPPARTESSPKSCANDSDITAYRAQSAR